MKRRNSYRILSPLGHLAFGRLRRTAPSAGGRKGFSLAELMVAIGIMGIGMVMVAALFPAAIKQIEYSLNDTLGGIIADNASAMAKAIVHQGDANSPSLAIIACETKLLPISYTNQHYDIANSFDPNRQGFVLLGMKDPNGGYLLVVVPYIKKGGGKVQAVSIQFQQGSTNNKLSFGSDPNANFVTIDSPVILSTNGEFAMIIDVDTVQKIATLDKPISGPVTAWVIYEQGSGRSPALKPHIIRTELQP